MENLSCILILLICFKLIMVTGEFRFRISSFNTCLPTANVLHTFGQVSAKQCMEECALVSDCVAINFNRRYKLCEMHSKSVEVGGQSSIPGACVLIEKQYVYPDENQVDCESCTNESTCGGGQCGRNFCPTLTLPNGNLLGNRNSEGSRVQYTCNKPLKESAGYTSSTCQPNNTWNHVPQCLQYFEYMGCYKDDIDRILDREDTESDQMTTEFCVNFCFDLGHGYALTQYYSQCFCGDVPRYYDQKDERECNTPCRGDRTEMCGGEWRASLYKRINV